VKAWKINEKGEMEKNCAGEKQAKQKGALVQKGGDSAPNLLEFSRKKINRRPGSVKGEK